MIVRRLVAALRRLRRDRRGNVLMIVGLSIIPLVFATGMGIDYSRAARMQTKLNAVADAAALAAVAKPMMSQSTTSAAYAVYNTWYAQATGIPGMLTPFYHTVVITTTTTTIDADDGNIHLTVTDTPNSTGGVARVAKIVYAAASTNSFAGVLGKPSLTIGGSSTAKAGFQTYYQIVFLVDVSNSMGVGGTAADITNLSNDKTIGCAFACHDPNGTIPVAASDYCDSHPIDYFCHQGQTYCPFGAGKCATVYPSKTYSDRRTLAKTYGYKLKIDYVNDAINAFLTQLKPKMDAAPAQFSVSIDTFGTNFAQLQSPTNSSSILQTAAALVDVEVAARSPAGYSNQGWTYTSNGMQSALAGVTNIGDGSSATARQTYVVFLSDGVEDTFDATDPLKMYNRVTSYNFAQQCQAIKNANVTMFSIEAAYPVIPGDAQYNTLVANLPSRNNGVQIADVMKGCASGNDKYYYASDGPAIQTAVNNVFNAIFSSLPRLSQ